MQARPQRARARILRPQTYGEAQREENRRSVRHGKHLSRRSGRNRSTAGTSHGISAEFVEIGAIRLDRPPAWAVIVDRISHDIPFYRAFLKHAVLHGTTVINNPVLVVGGRQILQLFAGREAGSGRSADRHPAAQALPARHHRPLHAEPAVSAGLGLASSTTSDFPRFSSR